MEKEDIKELNKELSKIVFELSQIKRALWDLDPNYDNKEGD